jgi:hypothetical protein
MVFSDKSSSEDPNKLMTKGLPYISECNESSEYGINESDTSKNLDLLNQQVTLAERNESSISASSG